MSLPYFFSTTMKTEHTLSDDELRLAIHQELKVKEATNIEMGILLGLPQRHASRLLTDLRRYRKAHITKWVPIGDVWYAVYKYGPGENAKKPQSTYKALSTKDKAEHILTILPLSHGAIAKKLGLSANGVVLALQYLVQRGLVKCAKNELGTLEYHDSKFFNEKLHNTSKPPQYAYNGRMPEDENGDKASRLTLPWVGYNKDPWNRAVHTTWRHTLPTKTKGVKL